MKYSVLFSVLTLLIILLALLFWRYTHIQGIYAQGYVDLEADIFLPDTDEKGFSDKVKKEIEKNFKDSQIKISLFKYAKAQRSLLRSTTAESYLIRLKESIGYLNCSSYLIDNSKDPQIVDKGLMIISIVVDNKNMKNFEIYLEKHKFNTKEIDSGSLLIMNDVGLRVHNEKEFNEKCNK